MRFFLFVLVAVALAKPKKDTTEAPPPPPAPAPAAEPEPAPAPVEEAPPAPTRVKNADLSVTMTKQDGSSKSMKVTGIERSSDFYGDEGWTSDEGDLKISLESGSTEKMVSWKDVKSVSVAPGKMPDDVDCSYSSEFTPWMYECTLKTVTTVVMKDGSKGVVNNRHKWRFSTDDGSSAEFWLFKHTARMQDDGADAAADAEENTAIYPKLQEVLRTEVKTTLVKTISVS